MESKIELRNIFSLSGMKFFIPDYQRGYRWSGRQVQLMLDDFKEFCDRISRHEVESGEFYCLQPIVVKAHKWKDSDSGREIEGYEVIDGQQRLTTLYIIIKYLESQNLKIPRKFEKYSITYQTRLAYDSQAFLENIDNPIEDSNDFIDFYYMREVYDAVVDWFEDREDYEDKIKNIIFTKDFQEDNPKDLANNVRVIWYEVIESDNDKTDSATNIFSRLNIGKIPLTNAELIKALLLKKGNFEQNEEWLRQVQISSEWNLIEQTLQDDDFWYFIHSAEEDYANRIEYIFDLMKSRTKDSEFYHTFVAFSQQLEDLKKEKINIADGGTVKKFPTPQSRVEYVWNSIKDFFQTLKEWYDNRELYHFIGYLIEDGYNIMDLLTESRKLDKDLFLESVKSKIKERLKKVDIETLSYDVSAEKGLIKKVLLLFNILTVLQTQKSDMRFPFSKFKKEKWDIEHIRSQNDRNNNLTDPQKRYSWLKDLLDYFAGDSEKEKIEAYINQLEKKIEGNRLLAPENPSLKLRVEEMMQELYLIKEIYKLYQSDKINDGVFEQVYSTAQKLFGEDKLPDINHIRNLALLDAVTNRGYGNAFFPVKRKWIIRNDEKGIFVPIATKNVFLKFYSPRVNKMMRWEPSDAEFYFEEMKRMLKDYLTPKSASKNGK